MQTSTVRIATHTVSAHAISSPQSDDRQYTVHCIGRTPKLMRYPRQKHAPKPIKRCVRESDGHVFASDSDVDTDGAALSRPMITLICSIRPSVSSSRCCVGGDFLVLDELLLRKWPPFFSFGCVNRYTFCFYRVMVGVIDVPGKSFPPIIDMRSDRSVTTIVAAAAQNGCI